MVVVCGGPGRGEELIVAPDNLIQNSIMFVSFRFRHPAHMTDAPLFRVMDHGVQPHHASQLIAEDVAYKGFTTSTKPGDWCTAIKSSNVLLGPDFEACITDYSNPQSDVYAYGVLLLELLTGKPPSEHPLLVPTDRVSWVKSVREDNGGKDNRMDMLVEVATTCSLTSPEQRPTMWQVLKMLQEIKEIVLLEDSAH
ncbi:probable inactive receptor kinase At5g67200 [Prosopis cineraria]|uniref:probable inactive receptor kinase At5g67200 n=1 Tax=Prosopis cineraria TaxID=364024 RepID=UPI0024102EE8|nr:probable inactive receptor kinase At5g67200 [Prosopis cineraria]